jgi:excisionase family DNA binding protein
MSASTAQPESLSSTQQRGRLLLTIPEAADALNVSRSILYELLLAGEVTSVKIGRSRRVPMLSLEEFVARRLADATSGK